MPDIQEVLSRFGDYRADEGVVINEGRLERWLQQFDPIVHDDLIEFLDRVGQKAYMSQSNEKLFIRSLLNDSKIVGSDPQQFWASVEFIPPSNRGVSQMHWQRRLNEEVIQKFNVELGSGSNGTNYVLVDDGIFSGDQVKKDLTNWAAARDPRGATVTYVYAAVHRFGSYSFISDTAALVKSSEITLNPFTYATFENRKKYRNEADVLWPTERVFEEYSNRMNRIIDASQFHPREGGNVGAKGLFRDDAHRSRVERAFLHAGCIILESCDQVKPAMKPLGYTRFRTPGFGATFLTHRNCPNNAPLALWWGEGTGQGALGWFPLFPRRVR